MSKEDNNRIELKKPEDLEWEDLINILKRVADKDNATARAIAYGLIEELENDEGFFWRMDNKEVLRLFIYAGYDEKDELIKLYAKFRDKNRYKEFLERQKAIRKANMANSPLGKLGARVKKFFNPNEQQPDSPENTTNDSNDGEAR